MTFQRKFLALIVIAILAGSARSEGALPGIAYYAEVRTNPPNQLFVAEVDLANPKIHLRVARGGPDPDGAGPWQTTLMTPTKIAVRERFDLVVNGDFFKALATKDTEGTNSAYRADVWAATTGPAMTDGLAWSSSPTDKPCLVVHHNGRVAIEMLKAPAGDDWEVVAGNTILVTNSVILPHQNAASAHRSGAKPDWFQINFARG